MKTSADLERDSVELIPANGDGAQEDATDVDVKALIRAIEELTDGISELISSITNSTSLARSGDRMQIGNLQLNPMNHQVLISKEEIDLSAGEFRMIQRLVSDYPEAVSFDDLQIAYHRRISNEGRNLRVYIRRLRLKLNSGIANWDGRIVNIRSVGYRIARP